MLCGVRSSMLKTSGKKDCVQSSATCLVVEKDNNGRPQRHVDNSGKHVGQT